jgi:hypothetical protein
MPDFRSTAALFTSKVLSWLVLCLGIGTCLFAAAVSFWSYTPLPCMDNWYFIYQVDRWKAGAFSLTDLLWSIHNGHRILIPHLFHLADFVLFQGKNYFLLVSILSAQLIHAFMFDRLAAGAGRIHGSTRRVAFGFVLFCLFSPVQRENFMCGWEIAYIIPFVSATVAFAALALHASQSRERSSNKWIVASVAAALIGNFSLASGILIWPILLLEAAALRLSKRALFGIAACTAIVIVLRVLDVSPENAQIVGSSLGHMPEVLRFFTALFSKSWSATAEFPGTAFTALTIASVIALFMRALIKGAAANSFRLALLCICIFAVLNAALTALGRWNLGIAGRYETPILLFWCAFGLIVLSYLASLWNQSGVLIFASVLLLLFAVGVGNLPRLRVEAKTLGEQNRVAQAAMASGVLDGGFVHIFAVPDAWTFGELNFLSQRRASLYSAYPTSRMGEQIDKSFSLRPQDCTGNVDHTDWVPDQTWSGISISGSVPKDRIDGQLKWLLVTNAEGTIVGFGSTSALIRAAEGRETVPGSIPWHAFVSTARASGDLFIYGLQPNGAVCAINRAAPVSPLHGPAVFDTADMTGLVEVWRPNRSHTNVYDGTFSIKNGVLTVNSSGTDTRISLESQVDLAQFQTLIFKAKFSRKDSVELFFGQQVNGRGLAGFAPITNQWVYVFAELGNNRFWKQEAGHTIRFDPTGGLGIGSITEISGVWGSRKPIARGSNPFEFAVAKEQHP